MYHIQGTPEDINNLEKEIEKLAIIKTLKIQKIEDSDSSILADLTSNQKLILDFARKLGYYDYPRRITSEELSEKIGIHKDITLENLRKAEKYIIAKILDEN